MRSYMLELSDGGVLESPLRLSLEVNKSLDDKFKNSKWCEEDTEKVKKLLLDLSVIRKYMSHGQDGLMMRDKIQQYKDDIKIRSVIKKNTRLQSLGEVCCELEYAVPSLIMGLYLIQPKSSDAKN